MHDHLALFSNPRCFVHVGLHARLEGVTRGSGKGASTYFYLCLDLDDQPAAQAATTTVNVLHAAGAPLDRSRSLC